MADHIYAALGPGERAPDFELPAADAEGRLVVLAEHLRTGPVLLTMFRGLYCPFCRRQISQLRPMCGTLRAAGISLIGIVIASAERSRLYFRRFPASFAIAAAPDRAVHRAYGLPEVNRTPELRQQAERTAAEILPELALQAAAGQSVSVFRTAAGFEMTPEDDAELERPQQSVGHFLIGRDGMIRWARVEPGIIPLPNAEDLLSLV